MTMTAGPNPGPNPGPDSGSGDVRLAPSPSPSQPGVVADGPLLVRLAEQLADARARLIVLETASERRVAQDEAYRTRTAAQIDRLQLHLERQDDMTTAVQAKLDAILAEKAEEKRQRADDRAERRQASRTMIRTVLLMVPSGLLSALATAMPQQLRIGVFATACVLAVGAILVDVIRGAARGW